MRTERTGVVRRYQQKEEPSSIDCWLMQNAAKDETQIHRYNVAHPTLPSHSVSRMPAYRPGGNREDIPLAKFTGQSSFDIGNVRVANGISMGKRNIGFGARSDSFHISGGKTRCIVRHTHSRTVLSGPVIIVFGFGRNLQMGWIAALRIIANVHNNHPLRNFKTGEKFVRIAVSADLFAAIHANETIPETVRGSFPYPAAIAFLDFCFERFIECCQRKFVQTVKATHRCVMLFTKPPRLIAGVVTQLAGLSQEMMRHVCLLVCGQHTPLTKV